MKRHHLVPVLAALAIAVAAPASAQWGRADSRPGYGYPSDVRRIAYDRGFREGVTEGEKDGRSRDPYRYQDEGDFRNADVGYNRSYGDRDRYRQVFRQGFADGYAEGYRRYSGRYSNGRYDDRGYGYPGGYGRNDRYLSPYDIGVRDGIEKGREDVRDNDRFDPRRHKRYRVGDHD
jgi:hypothetical protein